MHLAAFSVLNMQTETKTALSNHDDSTGTLFCANLLNHLRDHKEISRLDVFKNISTVNMEDFYTEFPGQAQKKRKTEDSKSVSQFLLDYPIIKTNAVIQRTSDLNGTASNTEEVNVNLTKEAVNKKPCSSSASTSVQCRILDTLQESRYHGTCAAFCERDSEDVGASDTNDNLDTSSITNAFPVDKLQSQAQLNVGERRPLTCSSLVEDAKTKDKHNDKSCFQIGKIFSRCVGKRDSAHTQIDEHFPKAKKLRTDVNFPPSEEDQSSSSRDSTGWPQKVFEKWGQKKHTRPDDTIVEVQKKSRASEMPNETSSSLESNSCENHDSDHSNQHSPNDKEAKRKKFRTWLKERASYWSRKDRNKLQGESKSHSSVARDSSRSGLVVEGACAINNESLYTEEAAVNYGVLSEEDAVLEEEEDGPSAGGPSSRPSRLRPRNYRQFLQRKEHRTRAYLKERSHVLGRWFVTHFTHPYPSKEQKDKLAKKTNMSRNQVSEWFGNMRRRIRDTTRDLAMCWEERVLRYNSLITGKSEPLPIEAHDSINAWKPQDRLGGFKGWLKEDEAHGLTECSPKNSSPSTNFKKGLLHRYLNDSSENLCSLPAPASDTENVSTSFSSGSRRPRSTHLDVRSKTEMAHSVPVARVDPWPSQPSSTSIKPITPVSSKSKSDSINANQIIVRADEANSSHDKPPQLRTYSRTHRGKSATAPDSNSPLTKESSKSLPLSSNFINYGALSAFQFFPIVSDGLGPRISTTKDLKSLAICPTAAQTLKSQGLSTFSLDCIPSRNETPRPTSTGNLRIAPRPPIFQSSKTFHGNSVSLSPIILSEKILIPGQGDRTQFPCNWEKMIIPSTATRSQPFLTASPSNDGSCSRSSDELSAAYTLMQLRKM